VINLLLGLFILPSIIKVNLEVVKGQELEADRITIQPVSCEGILYLAKLLETLIKQSIDVIHIIN
jgi:hypothetical protein